MNVIAALVLGLLIGWLVEWVIDWFYWRRRIHAVAQENVELTQRNASLSEENTKLSQDSAKLAQENVKLAEEKTKLTQENADLTGRIAALEKKVSRKSQLSKTKPIRDKAGMDNLQAIRGVGPVIAKRLNEAGIYTFEEMAQLTSEELEEVLGSLIRKFFPGEEKMIAQAKEFAQQKAQRG